ncbi:hypothetical protein AB0I55_20875 [Actinocatenispora sera]|uniref:hypothetical protein n=1 Tax=Actinocatenispora sera TaxID=390989 RepID=UPI0033C22925
MSRMSSRTPRRVWEHAPLRAAVRAARTITRADGGRDLLRHLRPACVPGVTRDGEPLWFRLYLANAEQRLESVGDAMAVMDPPRQTETSRVRRRSPLRYWAAAFSLLRFWPLIVLELAAAATIPFRWYVPAFWFGVGAIMLGLMSIPYSIFAPEVRRLIARSRNPDRPVAEATARMATSRQWSVSLLYAPDSKDVSALIEQCLSAAKIADGPDTSGTPLVVDCRAVAGLGSRAAVAAYPGAAAFTPSGCDLVVIGRHQPIKLAVPDARRRPVQVLPILLATVLPLLFGAWVIWTPELEACSNAAVCAHRPATYGAALYWLVERLISGDPNGFAAATWMGRLVGAVTTLYGWLLFGWILTAVLDRANWRTTALPAELIEEFNADQERRAAPLPKPLSRRNRPGQRVLALRVVDVGTVTLMVGAAGYVLGRVAYNRGRRSAAAGD